MTEGERQKVGQRLEAQSARSVALLETCLDPLDRIARALINQGQLSGDEVGCMLPDIEQPPLRSTSAA